MIADWRGPGKPFKTPSISTPNSCGWVPEKTVFAVPFIPGRRSSSANSRESATVAFTAGFCATEVALPAAITIATTRIFAKLFIKNNLVLLLQGTLPVPFSVQRDYSFRPETGQGGR